MFLECNEEIFITNDEVDFRNKLIQSIQLYQVDIHLKKGQQYSGTVDIHLTLNTQDLELEKSLQIDFGGKQVNTVKVKSLSSLESSFQEVKFTFQRNRIHVGLNTLKEFLAESNQLVVQISFDNEYNTTQQDRGLFSTTTGDNQYLYTQGEVASMHYFFPLIEQINFRAAYLLSLSHPSDWVVISNSSVQSSEQINNNEKKTIFNKTQPFPCYLYALFAGNYAQFSDKYNNRIDLNIFCRKEKEEFIKGQLKDLFDITKFGLQLMEEYTQIDYYLDKLDQVFCADYNFYGMENPGCISLEEKRYLFEEEREPLKVMRRAYIMFHEIAHMWFGDYVSIEWWNNLFLKEGFATFFGYKGVKEYFSRQNYAPHMELSKIMILPDENKDEMFSLSHKRMSYFSYCSFKAHNCVSYNKGGAFFEFLESKVYGEQKFKEQIREYLKFYSFSRVTEQDFIRYFPDEYSQKYIYKNHLSYFENNSFKDLKDLGLTDENYNKINLSYIIVSKVTAEIKIVQRKDHTSLSHYSGDNNVILLNTSDQHLIFNRINEADLKYLDKHKIISKFNLDQRITLWKSIIFENLMFEKKSYYNEFFLNNILHEDNLVILHYVLRLYPQFSESFSICQEDQLIQLYQTENCPVKKRILLKNLIRYISSSQNLFTLLSIYESQERKIKPKYLKNLQNKITKIFASSIERIYLLQAKQ